MLINIFRNDNFLAIIFDYVSTSPILLSNLISIRNESCIGCFVLHDVFLLFSGLHYIFSLILKVFFDSNFISTSSIWIGFLDQQYITNGFGINYSGHNTLYTLLAEPYYVLGFFGVCLEGFFIGYLLSYLEDSFINTECKLSLFFLYYLFFILLSGIFVSPFPSVTLWMIIFFIILFKNKLFISK
jgi:hypothetical protein